MRLATSSIHQLGYDAISRGTSKLYRLQNEFASQKRINSAADDPAGASRASELGSAKAVTDQFTRNQGSVQSTLQSTEGTVGDIGDLMQSIKETLISANNGALSDADRSQLATQLRSQRDQMLNLANSRDSQGHYIFAGYNESVAPFGNSNAGAVYHGDNGVKSVAVSAAVSMQTNVSGAELFMGVKGGNGVVQTGAATTNQGDALVDGGRVLDATGYDGSDFKVELVNGGSGLEVQVTNTTTSQVVASGIPYLSGQSIDFPSAVGGFAVLSVTLTGTPRAGDSFTIGAAQPTNIFDSMDQAISALESSSSGTLTGTGLADQLRQVEAQVDQQFDRSLSVRNRLGSSMQELDRQQSITGRQSDDLASRISAIVDLDPAKAATELAQAQTALQSSEQVYATLAKQSLFDYLK